MRTQRGGRPPPTICRGLARHAVTEVCLGPVGNVNLGAVMSMVERQHRPSLPTKRKPSRNGGRSHDHANRLDPEHTVQRRRSGGTHQASTRRRGRRMGHPDRQLRPDVPGLRAPRRRDEPDRLLVDAARLEEPDAHAQPQFDLSDAVLRHRHSRADRRRDPAGRGWLDHRHADGLLADRVRGRRPGRRRQGRGRQISDSPAGLRPAGTRRLFRVPVGRLPRLWPVALGAQGR